MIYEKNPLKVNASKVKKITSTPAKREKEWLWEDCALLKVPFNKSGLFEDSWGFFS